MTAVPGAVRGLLWFLGGAAFAPIVLFAGARAGHGIESGLWKRNDLLRSAEIWSPKTGLWERTGDLAEPIAGAEAVALRGGEALAVQATQQGLRAQAWSAGTWRPAGTLPYASRFRLLALRGGGALLAGTEYPRGDLQLYQNGAWRSLPAPGTGTLAAIAELPQGVLAVTSDPLAKLRTRALFLDLASGKWAEIAPPPETDYCTLTPLDGGRALFAFERRSTDPADTPLAIFEKGRFTLRREKLAANLAGLPSWAGRLDDGRVLHLVDNASRAIVWDPRTSGVKTLPSPVAARAPVLVPLGRGALLATGGTLPSGDENRDLWDPDATAAAVIWDLDAPAPRPAAPMLQARELHSAVLLQDGRVLAFGGRGPAGHVQVENAREAAEFGMLALAATCAAAWALVQEKRRIRALLLFLAGAAAALGVTALVVVSQIRYPS